MIKIIKIILALPIIFLVITGCSGEKPPKATVDIDAAEAARLLEENDDIAVIDVRSKREYRRGHLPRARLIPHSSPDFSSRLAKNVNNKPDTILVYCLRGSRSRRILPRLKRQTDARIYHLEEGIREWINHDLPVHHPPDGR